MASSLGAGGPGLAPGGSIPRRANLEFPPPPPYPPPLHHAAGSSLTPSSTTVCTTPIISSQVSSMPRIHSSQTPPPPPPQDYAYAYYEPGPSRLHPPAFHHHHQHQHQHQGQSTLRHHGTMNNAPESLRRHTYVTRYGTEENIYEEISEISRQYRRGIHGSRRSLVAEEVRRVQSRHRRVLGELNLSVEAMLMPPGSNCSVQNDRGQRGHQRGTSSTEELLASVSPTDELLSPVACDLDSGFSGSSSASYRSGLGSLSRGFVRTSTPELGGAEAVGGNNGQRKGKAVMLLRKGWKGWKKIQPFGATTKAKPTATRYLKKIAVPSQKLPVRQHDRVDSSPHKSLKIERKNRAESRAARSRARQSTERSPFPSTESDAELTNDVVVEAAEHEHNAVQSDPILPPTKEKGSQSDKFSLLSLIPDAAKLYTFTGLNSFEIFNNIVECVSTVHPESAKFVLPVKLRVALCLTKLKLNMPYTALSVLFGVSDETCSNYFRHTVQVLANVLKGLIYFPSKEEVMNNIPKCFKKYVHTRIVLDCAEVPVEKPKCLRERILTYSHYKGRHTLKFLVGVSPAGMITFLSPMFGGRASDKKIVDVSEVLDKCDYGDGVMVDKGFKIDEMCLQRSLRLIRPPFVRKNKPLTKTEALHCVDIAAARVHVERAIKQLRDFDILSEQVSGHLVPYTNFILQVCGALVNINAPILSMERF